MVSSNLDPNEICPASGLRNATCIRTVCDCFPDEEDRFGLHPERFIVAPWGTPGPRYGIDDPQLVGQGLSPTPAGGPHG